MCGGQRAADQVAGARNWQAAGRNNNQERDAKRGGQQQREAGSGQRAAGRMER